MGKFTMDIDLKEKVDALSALFIESEASKSTGFSNPYPKLAKALEEHALPKDSQVLIAVLDKIVAHKNPMEILQGATEGSAIVILTKLVNEDRIRPIIDQPSNEIAVNTLSSTVLRMAEAKILQNQISREMMREEQAGK